MSQPPATNIWLFLDVLARRRLLVVGLVLLAVVVSAVVSMLMPVWYEASALLLPSKEIMTSVTTTADLAEVASVTGGIELPIMVTPSDVYVRMLRSRAIADSIIEQFDLNSRYETVLAQETRDELSRHTGFRTTDEGLIEIRVEDSDPEIAAAIANAFVDELNSLNHQIVSSRARRSREFIGDRLVTIKEQLANARKQLEEFQSLNRALDFDEQTRLAINQASQLKIDMARVDIEIELREKVLGVENPELIDMRNRRKSIKGELSKLEFGGGDSSFFALPLASIPLLKGEYEAIYSRVKVNESVHMTLLELYEQAKIREGTESTLLSTLDRATVPEIRSRPQRTLIVMGSTAVALVLAIILALLLEYFRRLEEYRPDDYQRALRFINAYFGWLPGVRQTSAKR
jgi:tyrosine-protein kinase Etk/Wzc